jgi:hypothetical protein
LEVMVPLELLFDTGCPQASRANELARQLVTARAQVGASKGSSGADLALFVELLADVINETLREDEPTEFLVYLLAALSLVGSAGMWMAAEIRRQVSEQSLEEANAEILIDVMGALASTDSPKL